MNTRCIIVSNGDVYPGILDHIRKGDYVIGVDRAAFWLIENGRIPDAAVGDFDSATEAERSTINKNIRTVLEFVPEKDFTDTELAINHAIAQKPSVIHLYGGSGSRLDHELGVLFLLEKCMKLGIPVVFFNKTNEVRVLGRGRTILKKREGMQYISIIPITTTSTVTLSKLKYEIKNTTIHRGQTIGISNEFIGMKAYITIHTGVCFLIQSSD